MKVRDLQTVMRGCDLVTVYDKTNRIEVYDGAAENIPDSVINSNISMIEPYIDVGDTLIEDQGGICICRTLISNIRSVYEKKSTFYIIKYMAFNSQKKGMIFYEKEV
jgi:hypothetical protein